MNKTDQLAEALFADGLLDRSDLVVEVYHPETELAATAATFRKRLDILGDSVEVVVAGCVEPPLLTLSHHDVSPLVAGYLVLNNSKKPLSTSVAATLFTGLQQVHRDDGALDPLEDAADGTSDDVHGPLDGLTLTAELKFEILGVPADRWTISTREESGDTFLAETVLTLEPGQDEDSSIELIRRIAARNEPSGRVWGTPQYAVVLQRSPIGERLIERLSQEEIAELFHSVQSEMRKLSLPHHRSNIRRIL